MVHGVVFLSKWPGCSLLSEACRPRPSQPAPQSSWSLWLTVGALGASNPASAARELVVLKRAGQLLEEAYHRGLVESACRCERIPAVASASASCARGRQRFDSRRAPGEASGALRPQQHRRCRYLLLRRQKHSWGIPHPLLLHVAMHDAPPPGYRRDLVVSRVEIANELVGNEDAPLGKNALT